MNEHLECFFWLACGFVLYVMTHHLHPAIQYFYSRLSSSMKSDQALPLGTSPRCISPTLNLVQPCLCCIVFLYPFLLFVLIIVSSGLLVCSKTVKSHLTIHSGKLSIPPSPPCPLPSCFRISLPSAAGDLIEYSLDPTSNILDNDNVVPGGWSGLRVGSVKISLGWSR